VAKLTDNQKSLLILGGGIVFAIASGAGIYLDLGERDDLKIQIDEQVKQRDANNVEIARIPTLKRELAAYRKIVTDNAKILPTDDDIYVFFRDISNLEKEAGISIRTFPTYAPTGGGVAAITKFPMKMQLTATTRAFLRFLNQLESRERLVSVTDFRINPASEEPKPGTDRENDISVNFDLYRYDPKAAPQGVKSPFRSQDEELQLLEMKEVKDLIAAKGRPANIERYQLLAGRDNRRDLFVDPRRRLNKPGGGGPVDVRSQEEVALAVLLVKLERVKTELESYQNAVDSKDFLRQAALKQSFCKLRDALVEDLKKISANSPEFKSRDLQERYLQEVKRPFERLMAESPIPADGGVGTVALTEAMAAGMRKDLDDLMGKRMFHEAEEKWTQIDALVRDAGKKVEEAANPHIAAMRTMGEHAHFQSLLAEKKIEVQGIVRMERISAVIVNNRTLFPGKSFDKETSFLRVEEGGKGESDRLLFRIQGHEVDYIQPKPQLLGSDRAFLTQDDK
jgi:Tfp pilus assembly protein PilO